MHHQDFSGEQPGGGSRKAAFHYRRGSGGAGGAGAAAADEAASPAQAGSSSPALHHQPQVAGTQVKKKSGFQITSVTSAQISGNNSLADDTESYDDMDESHTEDLSSSDILDVSVSKATDTGVPERSSSDETLNSLHGVDTPGLVSPNEPLQPHAMAQGSQQHSSLVNGTVQHQYYPQQQSQALQHHSDSLGGGEPSPPAALGAPVSSSSPAGLGQSQLPPVLDNPKAAGVAAHQGTPIVADARAQGSVNVPGMSSVSAVPAAAVPPSGPAGFDSTNATVQAASAGGGTGVPVAAPSSQLQHTHSITAPGSRFRVVKLDTNSEPFRKGRWTCTEYYEKEVPQPPPSEAPKAVDLAVETEAGNTGIGPCIPAVQPPHTLQPYQTPSQDFTSPQAMQSPPQPLTQAATLSYASPQEVVGATHMQKQGPPATVHTATQQMTSHTDVSQAPVIPQQIPYAMDQQQGQTQGGYAAPQLHAGGVMVPGGVRQPDFIQPTAPFQTQVQPPLPLVTTGISVTPAPVPAQQPGGITQQQLPHQGQVAPPAPAAFAAVQPQTLPVQPQPNPQAQIHPSSTGTLSFGPPHGSPYMPLTALQADLQPLLTSGTHLSHVPAGGSFARTSQLESAQRLLFQHQGLLGLPRMGMAASGEGSAEGSSAVGTLAHMGMSAEASAIMAAAAAGLRSQHAEGEEDSSSGASVVAIDNKIEQAMDLVKSHLMYAVREEVEVLKEQIKELIERNTQLEQENNLLKNLASPEQMAQFQAQVQTGGSPTGTAQPPALTGNTQALPSTQNSGTSA
ncbi:TSC22 domain family protein 1 isoform X1 [Cololabis saira]|uniref:TSC22 domain family protein 1 isoform X1 n=1 Tax=Cololabis saira TaxID=129043 RepID=UPI002AD4517A|nr:TSC22 domain family protein 1 isoform X1 [Cololabis saira]